MSNVVDLDSYRKRTWLSGPVLCTACRHEWVGVFPEESRDVVECPECGRCKGVLKFPVVPEVAYVCNSCDGVLFYITPEGCTCRECGTLVEHDDL